jgi:DNA modification methylase
MTIPVHTTEGKARDPFRRKVVVGDCVLYLADCRDVIPTLIGVDTVFTSPPYAQQRTYGQSDPFDWDGVVPPALASIVCNGQTQVLVNLGLVHRDGELWEYWRPLLSAMRASGWKRRAEIIWDQLQPLPGRFPRLNPSHERIFHFAKTLRDPAPWIPTGGRTNCRTGLRVGDRVDTFTGAGERNRPYRVDESVWRVRRDTSGSHVAAMPVELPIRALRSWPGCVLDPFLGSGTTLVAAVQRGFKAIGIEQHEPYFESAVRRVIEAYAQPKLPGLTRPEPQEQTALAL